MEEGYFAFFSVFLLDTGEKGDLRFLPRMIGECTLMFFFSACRRCNLAARTVLLI